MIAIAPGPAALSASVEVPGSKYEANRFLIAAALTEGTTHLTGLPPGEDIGAAIAALEALGAATTGDRNGLAVRGVPGRASQGPLRTGERPRTVSVGESGTLLRFLSAAAAAAGAPLTITGSGRIGQRPVAGLVTALRTLGADVETREGYAPLTVRPGLFTGGTVRVPVRESSQFASALLLAAPRAPRGVLLELESEPVSASYLDLTVRVMARCGVAVARAGPRAFRVTPEARYRPGEHRISGDWTTASYFFAAAALAPGSVTVHGLDPDSPQGERRFVEILDRMGCSVQEEATADGARVTVTGAARLRGVTVDMGAMPDAAPTLAAVAPFADGATRIHGIGHLRHKESDRLAALAEGLHRLGVRVEAEEGALTIGSSARTASLVPEALDPHGDHRIAMALALTGLRIPGVRIRTPEVVAKSFPGYWEALARLGIRVARREDG